MIALFVALACGGEPATSAPASAPPSAVDTPPAGAAMAETVELIVRSQEDAREAARRFREAVYGDGDAPAVRVMLAAPQIDGLSLQLGSPMDPRQLDVELVGQEGGTVLPRGRIALCGRELSVRDLALVGSPSSGVALALTASERVDVVDTALVGHAASTAPSTRRRGSRARTHALTPRTRCGSSPPPSWWTARSSRCRRPIRAWRLPAHERAGDRRRFPCTLGGVLPRRPRSLLDLGGFMPGHQRRAGSAPTTSTSTSSAGAELQVDGSNAAASEELHRGQSGRNPADYDVEGNTSTHADVGAGDAVNTDASMAEPEIVEGEREVHPLYTDANRLELNGTPAASDLYEERASTGECVDGWTLVDGIIGSPSAPSRLRERDPDTIFIDGMPSTDDIHQGSIGDCYFLAAVTNIASADPGHLRDMFTVNGNQVQVAMFSYDSASSAWMPRTVSVDMSFLHATDDTGAVDYLLSSGFRMGETPTRSEWYADDTSDSKLWVCEDAQYEFALWAPLLEKAYARLAERYGQYGGAYSGDANSQVDDDGNAVSGYEIIEGGFTQYVYGMIYGDAEVANTDTFVDYDAEASGSELVANNLDMIENLLKVGGAGVAAGQEFYMSLHTSSRIVTDRLIEQLDRTLALGSVQRHTSFVESLEYVKTLCTQYGEAEDASDQDAVDSAANRITEACTRMAEPGAWPILDSERDEGAYQDLRDLLQVAQNLGTDASDGRRLTYADHAYAVLGATLRDASGGTLAITPSDLHSRHAEIDAVASTVLLRNPHGTNEPDVDGNGADDGQDNGEFSLPLEQALRVFGWSENSLVRT